MLSVLFEDDYYIAINKPPGLLVHRSSLAADAEEFALQMLRDQIQHEVHPCHRLDRKTSGVLLFAKTREALTAIRIEFEELRISKEYLAVLRGYSPERGKIEYPLTNDKGKVQEAITNFETLKTTEIDVPFGKFNTSRYSLVKAIPVTGRMHQLRKHFAHILHPIIGDRPHGCNKQNRLFKEKWALTIMLLHAEKLSFEHPFTNSQLIIHAPIFGEFKRALEFLNFSYSTK
jgi:tRNA pseudouridine65 synthase